MPLVDIHLQGVPALVRRLENDTDWLDALNFLAKDQDFDLVIPCNDFAVIPLQNERKGLRSDTKWYLLDDHAFFVAFDKAETSRIANVLEINTPREFSVDADSIDGIVLELFRLTSDHGGSYDGWESFVVNDRDEKG